MPNTERIRVQLSYFLKATKRNDHRLPLKARIRVYTFGRMTDDFTIYITDGKEAVFLKKGELIKGQISNDHPKSIRLNELLKAITKEVDTIIKTEMATTSLLKVDIVRERLDTFLQRFNGEYLEFLKREMIDIGYTSPDGNPLLFDPAVVAKTKDQIDREEYTRIYSIDELRKRFPDRSPKELRKLSKATSGKHKPRNFFDRLITEQYHLEKDLLTEKVKRMATAEIYKQGLWDKTNIFQMFGSIYYDDKVPETYHKIVIRLMEYREHRKPPEDVKTLDAIWLIDFFSFLKEKGWYNINTVNFDPLNYDTQRFFLDTAKDPKQRKVREPFKPKSLNKMIGMVKTVVAGNRSKFSFYKKGYLPKLDLSDLRLSAITEDKDKDGTRIEHNLTKEELDQLYWFSFDGGNLPSYQQIFDRVNKSANIKICIDDLETARALFILQVSFGGLRGYKELTTAKILKHSSTTYKVTFYQNKVTQTVTNPLNEYSEGILKPLGYKMPELKRANARKNGKAASTKMLEGHYRALLQTIGHIINFDREVLTDDVKFIHEPIKELFNPYFSRKTFGTILYYLRVLESDIELFTGHKPRDASELTSSYIQKNSIENKKEIISVFKIGNNPYL